MLEQNFPTFHRQPASLALQVDLVSSRFMILQRDFSAEAFTAELARNVFSAGDSVRLYVMIIILLIVERRAAQLALVELFTAKKVQKLSKF